jgi:hypothetical protein
VCFAYFDWQAQTNQKPRDVLRLFLKQAMRIGSQDILTPEILQLYGNNGERDFTSLVQYDHEIIKLLDAVLQSQKHVFLCLDALDECDKVARNELFEALSKLPDKFKVFMTSRRTVSDIGEYLDGLQVINVSASEADIHAYLRQCIDRDKKLYPKRMNERLESAIVTQLSDQAKGL